MIGSLYFLEMYSVSLSNYNSLNSSMYKLRTIHFVEDASFFHLLIY